ncbi:Sec-independent protein translocase protein TatB [Sphingomonas sp. KC8]|uniref:Sec-independent protein translocase protein TatB n=1 Tax=Sphingomonas sp. KC8 TaxID=1030157 RepID=UPI0002489C4F|nr:Sec-independent protein translocase protein TatB [Sphingomonas sp. KC8]ARS27436.1 twin-arginine translocation protein subunit TatB [Sphingomonas sp. KC8]
MFDIAPTELMLVALVALVVIGPKDLPRLMRIVGNWVAKARGMARHFRSGMDEMIRQSEIEEMERKWAAENERIMREHPVVPHDADAAQVTVSPEASGYAAPADAPYIDAPYTELPPGEVELSEPPAAIVQPEAKPSDMPPSSALQAELPLLDGGPSTGKPA